MLGASVSFSVRCSVTVFGVSVRVSVRVGVSVGCQC